MIYTNQQLQNLLRRALVAITGETEISAAQFEAHVFAIVADCAKVRAQAAGKTEAGRLAQAETELTALRSQLAEKDERIKTLETEVKSMAANAPRLAVKMVAGICHKPAAFDVSENDSGGDLVARFEAETDPDKKAALYAQIMATLD
jgi:hypothetical protein